MNTLDKLWGQKQQYVNNDKFEMTVHQGGDCIKLKVNNSNMVDVMRAMLDNGCGVHVVKADKREA